MFMFDVVCIELLRLMLYCFTGIELQLDLETHYLLAASSSKHLLVKTSCHYTNT